jgi:hypothetical protein
VAGTSVELVLDIGDGDGERAEEELQYLLTELRQTDVASIERVSRGPAPDGVRSDGGVELGALLIGLGGSGAALPVMIGLLKDWLVRRRSGAIRLKIGSDELELTGASDEMQRRALEEFVRRHKA